jgi:probable phosphoglycerate mutase
VTTLLLIRHGMNDWVSGKLAGWTPGVHLNEQGRQQARDLSTRRGDL